MCGRRAVWCTGREYPTHAFDGLGQGVAVTEDGDEALQVLGVAQAVARDEPLDPSPGTACQLWVDTGDGDYRGAGHRPFDPAWCRPRTGSRRPVPARRSPGRALRIEIAIERRVPRPRGGGAFGAPGCAWSLLAAMNTRDSRG